MTASKRRAGVRRGRFGLLGAVAATAAIAFGATSAQAAPVPLSATFDDAALNLPAPQAVSRLPSASPRSMTSRGRLTPAATS